MRIVLQRVREASVTVLGRVRGRIGKGICLLVGLEAGDTREEAASLARKIAGLRIFSDKKGKMNLSLEEVGGEILAVSQFTLAASLEKGRRPSFEKAEEPERAEELFRFFVEGLRSLGFRVETGVFGARMEVRLVNDGPVTFVLEGKKPPRKISAGSSF